VLRYVSVGDEVRQHELTIPIAANLVSSDEAAAAAPDLEVREEVLVLQAARARKEAIELADRGDFDSAQKRLSATASELRSAKDGMSAKQAALLEDEAERLDGSIQSVSSTMYLAEPSVRKNLRYQARQSQRRRRRR